MQASAHARVSSLEITFYEREHFRLRILLPLDAAPRKRATAVDKVSSIVNYVHVKCIASIPCGHISYLLGPLAIAITLEPLDIPTRIAMILYLDYPLSVSQSLVAPSISPFHFIFLPPPSLFLSLHFLSDISQCRFRLTRARSLSSRFSNPATKHTENRSKRRDRSNRYGHDVRFPDRRKSTWNNRIRCGGT